MKTNEIRNVYLAGPIEGCDDSEINDWRNKADGILEGMSANRVRGISPFRAQEKKYDGTHDYAKAIIAKNFYDSKKCEAILAYLPKEINERRHSYGTTMEIAWFYMMQKPIFLVTDDAHLTWHPIIRGTTGFIYDDLADGCQAIVDLLDYGE